MKPVAWTIDEARLLYLRRHSVCEVIADPVEGIASWREGQGSGGDLWEHHQTTGSGIELLRTVSLAPVEQVQVARITWARLRRWAVLLPAEHIEAARAARQAWATHCRTRYDDQTIASRSHYMAQDALRRAAFRAIITTPTARPAADAPAAPPIAAPRTPASTPTDARGQLDLFAALGVVA